MRAALPIFAVLILSIGVPSVFATHETPPTLDCPAGSHVGTMSTKACLADNISREGAGNPVCLCNAASSHPDCIFSGDIQTNGMCILTSGLEYIAGTETLDPPITISEQCQDNAILDPATNHCVPDPNFIQVFLDRIAQLLALLIDFGAPTEAECADFQATVDQRIADGKKVPPKLLSNLETCAELYG